MFDAITSASINHLLRNNTWARTALQAHADKVACFNGFPMVVRLRIQADGLLAAAAATEPVALTLSISPGLAIRLLAQDETAWPAITIDGDAALAQVIHHLWRHLRWDAEADLARVVGDVTAHRIHRSGQQLQEWAGASAREWGYALAEYVSEEQGFVTSTQDLAQFNTEVDILRDAIARLEKRIERLQTP